MLPALSQLAAFLFRPGLAMHLRVQGNDPYVLQHLTQAFLRFFSPALFLWHLPEILGSVVVGYLLGSFPSGYVIGRLRGIDIRQHGSGNIGATNVFRTLGRKWGVLVFALDMAKGVLAVRAAFWLLPLWGECLNALTRWSYDLPGHTIVDVPMVLFATPSLPAQAAWLPRAVPHFAMAPSPIAFGVVLFGILAGLGCFLGHCFPVWLKFKGGKGIAVGAGIVMGLMPLAAVLGLALWGVVFKLTRYVSLASVAAAVSLPVIVWLLAGRQTGGLFWFALAISLIAIWRHRSNIQRLLAGTESRFEKRKPAQENDSNTSEK